MAVSSRRALLGASGGVLLALSTVEEGKLQRLKGQINEKSSSLGDSIHKASSDARHALGIDAATRFGRSAAYGALVAVDYKMSLGMSGVPVESPEYKALQSQVHLRSAKRLLYVCQTHQGCYIKFGQFIASLVRIIPDEWTDTLRVLQDSNPGVPIRDIERLFRDEFGMPLQSLFRSFEPKPLAAASLAQVHKAVTHDGEVVAVKCQYPRLSHQIESDMWTITQMARVIGIIFKVSELNRPVRHMMGLCHRLVEYEYTWLFPEFRESMSLELDFHQEATNAERVARLFSGDRRVFIPPIRWDLSTKRILTMEFIDGVKVNNVPALKKLGINPVAVGDALSTAFSHMIFYFGFVHCDPHPGNLLIRKPPDQPYGGWLQALRTHVATALGLRPNFQVVILDHGMYRRLNESFRRSYGNLWKAFMTRDVALGREATTDLGLDPELFEVLSLISVNRTPTSATSLGKAMSAEESKALRTKYKDRQKYGAEKLQELLSSLPRDVLFVLRTNALVRSINSELGTPQGTRFRIFGSSAVKGLSIPNSTQAPKEAYFLNDIRDYSQRLPGKGRVIQKRTKAEILARPQASVNQPTACERFLFCGERLPRLKELRRQVLVADLRLRVWVIDECIECATWLSGLLGRWRQRQREKAELGEELLQEQLRVKADRDMKEKEAAATAAASGVVGGGQ